MEMGGKILHFGSLVCRTSFIHCLENILNLPGYGGTGLYQVMLPDGRMVWKAVPGSFCGRRVPWWVGAVSSCMAMVSCFVFIAYAQIGYEDGLVGVTIFWSTAVAFLGDRNPCPGRRLLHGLFCRGAVRHVEKRA